jgi:septal ring factor EnvC (AmiA/AmiB activator)
MRAMKKSLTFVIAVLLIAQAGAQTADYLQQQDFQKEKRKINEGINALKKQVADIKKYDAVVANSLDSIKMTLEMNAVQLFSAVDSLDKANTRINELQQEFTGQKLISRDWLILIFIIIFLIFAAMFFLLYRFRTKAEFYHDSLIDLDKKTNERLEKEIRSIKVDLQKNSDAVHSISADLNYKISTGLRSLETQNGEVEKQHSEHFAGIEEKIDQLRRESEVIHQGFAARADKVEEALKTLKTKNR